MAHGQEGPSRPPGLEGARIWLCGNVALWLCGNVAMWLCGCVAMWLCGYVAIWQCGYVAIVFISGNPHHPSTYRLPPLNILENSFLLGRDIYVGVQNRPKKETPKNEFPSF